MKYALIILILVCLSGCSKEISEKEIYHAESRRGYDLGYETRKKIEEHRQSGFSAGFDAGYEKADRELGN